MRAHDSTIIGIPVKVLADAGVRIHERLIDASGRTVSFLDGGTLEVTAVLWATGFRHDYSWLDVPGALDEAGVPIHHRGVSPVQGLYFLGLPWLHTTGSALIGFVASDAKHLMDTIAARRR
jgi:putative flavoprotein involved in K+ transport